jgi:hypothetical protein
VTQGRRAAFEDDAADLLGRSLKQRGNKISRWGVLFAPSPAAASCAAGGVPPALEAVALPDSRPRHFFFT